MSFEYNSSGLRTQKTVNGETKQYLYSGDLLVSEYDGLEYMNFTYSPSGEPVGLSFYDDETNELLEYYYYLKNVQGDIIGLYDELCEVHCTYAYDAWGNLKGVYDNSGRPFVDINNAAFYNPLRYRGYYYDSETELYYLNSRYYNPEWGRFISADDVVSGTGEAVSGYNLYSYCFNNPVNLTDSSGCWPQWVKNAANWVNKNVVDPVKKFFKASNKSNVSSITSNNNNYRPYTGKPGSTYEAPNGDTRTYGQDGKPIHDYDHNDHGRPDKHPHDKNGGHNHDWNNGSRGPAYTVVLQPVIGAALVTICLAGVSYVIANDVSGAGIADDFLLIPLTEGIREGFVMVSQ